MRRKKTARKASKWKTAIDKYKKQLVRTTGTKEGESTVKKLSKAYENYYNAIGAK